MHRRNCLAQNLNLDVTKLLSLVARFVHAIDCVYAYVCYLQRSCCSCFFLGGEGRAAQGLHVHACKQNVCMHNAYLRPKSFSAQHSLCVECKLMYVYVDKVGIHKRFSADRQLV